MRRLPGAVVLLGVMGTCAAPPAQAADTCLNAAVRMQQNAGHLQNCRAYEQVSLPEKGGNDATQLVAKFASVDGGRFVYTADGSNVFGNAQNAVVNQYVARRAAAGWSSTGVSPRTTAYSSQDNVVGFIDFACDLCSSVVGTVIQPVASGDNDPRPGTFAGAPDVYISSGPDAMEWLSGGPVGGTAGSGVAAPARYVGRSADGSHVAFDVGDALLPEVAAAGVLASRRVAYERTGPGLGELRVVGLADDGSVMPGGSRIGGAVGKSMLNAVSSDGRRIFFESPDTAATAHLYLRADGSRTVDVSAPQCSGAVPTCDGTGTMTSGAGTGIGGFQGASSDGGTAYFASADRLVDSDTDSDVDLYRYDVDGDRLTRVSAGPAGSGLNTLYGVSEDGGTVYFMSPNVLTTEPNDDGAVAQSGFRNIYAYRGSVDDPEGTIRFVGAFATVAVGDPRATNFAMSPDGDVIALSGRPDGPVQPNQVYRYDWDSRSVECLSCAGSDESVLFSQRTPDQTAGTPTQGRLPFARSRNVSDDGRSVFFESASPLVASDTNNRIDVYEWSDGVVSLVSSGADREHSYFFDASRDGSSVFIGTWARLAASDTDSALDVYDARVGGGWVVSPPSSCSGDLCQGEPTGSPHIARPASPSLSLRGDVNPAATARFAVGRPARARGASVTLRVRTPGTGRIQVFGPNLRTTERRVTRARVHLIRARLSSKAMRLLRRGRNLTVRVTVAFVPSEGATSLKRVPVTFEATSERLSRRGSVGSDKRKGR